MTPEYTRKLIAAAGGNKAFCLRIFNEYSLKLARRVDAWRNRGIPPRVQLDKRNDLSRLDTYARRRGLM